MRRRNGDWDDLPPMFTPLPGTPERRAASDEWEDLPPVFTPPSVFMPPAPIVRTPEPDLRERSIQTGITIPLDFPFWQIKDVRLALDILERTDDPVVNRLVTEGRFGDTLFLPDLESAAMVHSAVRSLVTDRNKDDKTRNGALEIIKRIEAVTGLHPNQGLLSKQTYELVAHAQTALVSPDRYVSLVRTPTGEDPNYVKRVMDMFPETFQKAYANFWDQYESLGIEEQITLAGGEVGDRVAARHFWAMSEALWVFAEMLGKAGVEARVIERQVFDPSDFVIWFHDPAEPYLLEIELGPELFWDLDTGALHATGRVELPERGFSYFLNRIDKGEEDEWLETFEEGIQPNPGDVGFEGDPRDWQTSLAEIGDVMHDGRVPTEWVEEWSVHRNPSEADIPPHAAPHGGTTKRVEKFVIYRHKPCEKKTGKPVVWRRGFTVDVDRWTESGSPEGAARYVPSRTRMKETWWAPDARGFMRPATGPPGLPCPLCGREVWGDPVRGAYRADIACTAKCVAALGSDCECSCAGKNHGSAHS